MELKLNQLSPTEFYDLWNSVWSDPPSCEQIKLALSHTIFSVSMYDCGRVVGMARMIGDMGMCYYIKDVAVRPEYQHRGIGKMMIDALMTFVQENGIPGSSVFVELASEPKNAAFYEKFGFSHNAELRLMKMQPIAQKNQSQDKLPKT